MGTAGSISIRGQKNFKFGGHYRLFESKTESYNNATGRE